MVEKTYELQDCDVTWRRCGSGGHGGDVESVERDVDFDGYGGTSHWRCGYR